MKTARLSELVENRKSSYGNDLGEGDADAFVVKVSNVSGAGQFHGEFERRSFSREELAQLTVRSGDLCVVKSSGSKTNVLSGKTALVTSDTISPLVASNFCFCLRPNVSLVEPRYLWRVLNSPASKSFIATIVSAFTYPNLKWSTYSNHPIPLPPLPEQKRIAAILDTADALRAKRRESIKQLDSFIQATFLEMFGDPKTNPKRWAEKPLDTLVERVTVGHVGNTTPFYRESGIPFLRTQNVGKRELLTEEIKHIDEAFDLKLKKSQIAPGDVLLSRVITDAVRAAVVPDGFGRANCANIVIVRPGPNVDPYYLVQLLCTSHGQRQLLGRQVGSAQKVVNTKAVQGTILPFAPSSLQSRFGFVARTIEQQKTRLKAHLSELDNLFASLQSRAFNGELVA